MPAENPIVKKIEPASVTKIDGKLIVKCAKCGGDTVFDQPYAYHAGFSDSGFMYSDSGHFTLTWNPNDPAMKAFKGMDAYPSVAHCFPPKEKSEQELDIKMRRSFEHALPPAPDGTRWRFENPARCIHCSEPIAGSMFQTVYYLVYPGSISTDLTGGIKLSEYLKPEMTANS